MHDQVKPVFHEDVSRCPVFDHRTGCDDFYVGISKLPGDHQQCQLDSSISFVVVNSDSDDNEDMYTIDLTESEKECVFDILNRQCRRYHGKDCAALLAEAEAEMSDD